MLVSTALGLMIKLHITVAARGNSVHSCCGPRNENKEEEEMWAPSPFQASSQGLQSLTLGPTLKAYSIPSGGRLRMRTLAHGHLRSKLSQPI